MKRITSTLLLIALLCSMFGNYAVATTNTNRGYTRSSDEITSGEISSTSLDPVDIVKQIDSSINTADVKVKELITPDGEKVYEIHTEKQQCVYSEPSIADIATAYSADPAIRNVKLKNNVLTYTLPDGTNGSLIEYFDKNGNRSFEAKEGKINNTLTYDFRNENMLLNGKKVFVSLREVYVLSQQTTSSSKTATTFIFHKTSYPEMQSTEQIRTMTTTIMLSLLYVPLKAIGVIAGVATTIVQTAKDIKSNSKAVYVKRYSYHDASYSVWKYVDNFYLDKNYRDFAKTNTTIIYNGN